MISETRATTWFGSAFDHARKSINVPGARWSWLACSGIETQLSEGGVYLLGGRRLCPLDHIIGIGTVTAPNLEKFLRTAVK
jgi:hypothetical protein